LRQGILVGNGINQKHRLARFYRGALIVQASEQNAAHPRPYLDFLGTFGLRNRFGADWHAGRLHLDHTDRKSRAASRQPGSLIIFAARHQRHAYNQCKG